MQYGRNIYHIVQITLQDSNQTQMELIEEIEDCGNVDAATTWEIPDMQPEEHSEGDLSMKMKKMVVIKRMKLSQR